MKDYSVLNGMIENQKSELRTAYDKGYSKGITDIDALVERNKAEELGYKRGMEAAWECCKRIITMPLSDQEKIFNMQDEKAIMDAHSAEEAIDILKRYDEKHYDLPESMRGEINIGDVVRNLTNGHLGIVVKNMDEDQVKIIGSCGNTGVWELENCDKTGRCFKDFAEALLSLQDDE